MSGAWKKITLDEYLVRQVERSQWHFAFAGTEVFGDELATGDFFLPVILWRAEQLHKLGFGRFAGVRFHGDENAYFGARADIAPIYASRTILMYFCREALQEQIVLTPRGEPASLDGLATEWIESAKTKLIPGLILGPKAIERFQWDQIKQAM